MSIRGSRTPLIENLKLIVPENINMNYNIVETVLEEMITSKDINVSILYNSKEYIVIDSKGLYPARGFKTKDKAKEYILIAYNLKGS